MGSVLWVLLAVWFLLGPLFMNDCDRDYLGLNDKDE